MTLFFKEGGLFKNISIIISSKMNVKTWNLTKISVMTQWAGYNLTPSSATQSLPPSPLKPQLYPIPIHCYSSFPLRSMYCSKIRPVISFLYIISVNWVIILLLLLLYLSVLRSRYLFHRLPAPSKKAWLLTSRLRLPNTAIYIYLYMNWLQA